MLRKILNPTCFFVSRYRILYHDCPYTRNHLGRLAEVGASLHGVGLGEVVFDQSQSDVVTHFVELFVHLRIIAFVVFAELCDNSSVRQGDELSVHLIDSGSVILVRGLFDLETVQLVPTSRS